MLTASETHKSERRTATDAADDVRPSFLATAFGCFSLSYSSETGTYERQSRATHKRKLNVMCKRDA